MPFIPSVFKGLLGNLILGNDVIADWSVYPLDIDTAVANGWLQSAHSGLLIEAGDGPIIYSGTLKPTGLAWDTFVKLNGWTKVRLICIEGLILTPTDCSLFQRGCLKMLYVRF